jgi:hypothetical protein
MMACMVVDFHEYYRLDPVGVVEGCNGQEACTAPGLKPTDAAGHRNDRTGA